MSITKVSTVSADGVDVFYRHAGPASAPTILLLHGFPSSSHQFRNLIPLLATKYHVVAPDIPGYGFTVVPEERQYKYTFANFATTIGALVDALAIKKFAVYIFDYGAPTGLRLALQRPEAVAAIISQNGNAYVEGFGKDFWAPIEKYQASGKKEDRDALRPALLSFEATKWQYTFGAKDPDSLQPEAWTLDQALMDRPGNQDIQLDIFYDYATNVKLYPDFQEFFRKYDVPVLTAWGKKDVIFVPPGAEAFKKDVKKLETKWLDAGHFAIENNEELLAGWIGDFLVKFDVFKK
ncbi:Alpha/Beta hydrolase protein [Coniochaeta sp. 2T2.1]|nr:Alpha/Beta hydrolase protein [Coniochaeta sp. 2T2.1]